MNANHKNVSKIIIIVSFFIFHTGQLSAQDLSDKANHFLSVLSPELKSQTQFSLEDKERLNMHFIPITRKGPTFHDFGDEQKKAALDLLSTSLGQEGYRKSIEIMELEKVLIIIEENRFKMQDGTRRDPLNYHFCIFGDPSSTNIWGWRFEGHHLSLNFLSEEGNIVSSTPSFFGSNPGVVQIEEQKGREVLKSETELGFKLVNALSKEQQSTAIFSETAPREIITGTDVKVKGIDPKGICITELEDNQRKIFMDLLNIYIDNYELGFSKTLRAKIEKAGLEKLYFAWAGGLEHGTGHYYRIQGPMLLIEYDNTQNNANHVHSVVRDLTNDFAEDILKAHYQNEH
jgi:hypothetical protein